MYKTNPKDENPLWRKYMDNVDMMDNKWLKELKTPFPSLELDLKSYSVYSEDEFLEKLESDKEFNEMWGKLKNS